MHRPRKSLGATSTLLWLLVGCGAESAEQPEPPAASVDCALGEYPHPQGTCCPMGTEALADGSCQPAGIADDECGEGFLPDGAQGCAPVLPATSCPAGELAVPGEATCRDVAPCGDGRWGDVVVDGDTQFVDASYPGGDGDGSADRPWSTIQAGIDAAPPGGVVAIAAGSYPEDVRIESKPVRLWGRCPAMVEVTGAGVAFGAISVESGASQTEVHQLAVTGSQAGLTVAGSTEVVLDRLWIHDTEHLALDVEGLGGETSAVLQGSLVERCPEVGVLLGGAELTIDESAIRDVRQPTSGPYAGQYGFGATLWNDYGWDAILTVTGSVIERATLAGIYAIGGSLLIERTAIRSTQPDAYGDGRGVEIEPDPYSGEPGYAVIDRSLIADSRDLGVFVAGSSLSMTGTVVRDTVPNGQAGSGRGVNVQSSPTEIAPTRATITGSVIAHNQDVGLFVSGAEVEVVGSLIGHTGPDVHGRYGRGLNVRSHPNTDLPARVQLRATLITDNQDVGIFVGGSELLVERSAVRNSSPLADGTFGDGLAAVSEADARAAVDIVESAFDAAGRAGLANFGSTVRMQHAHVVCCPIFLNGEMAYPGSAGSELLPFVFEDQGDNRCGCQQSLEGCTALSAGLAPPDPL